MFSLFVFETILVAIATLSSYLTWGPLTSKEMIFWFSPSQVFKTEIETRDAAIEKWRKTGMKAEISRTLILYLISLLALSFYAPGKYFNQVYLHPFFRHGVALGILISIYWNFYYGPRHLAIRDCGHFKFFSKDHFKKYSKPYWIWSLYPITMFVVLGFFTLLIMVLNISDDLAYQDQIIKTIGSIKITTIQDLQLGIIQLNQFGYWIASVSQKYILTTLLFFAYLLFEQRSLLHSTILDSSVERLKLAGWILMFFAIGYSLIFLPIKYTQLHSGMLENINSLVSASVAEEDLGDILSSQSTLQDHDLQWLVLYSLTGFGNLVSYFIIAFAIFTWRAYFSKYPLRFVVQLLVPKIILNGLKNTFGDVQVELDLNKDI